MDRNALERQRWEFFKKWVEDMRHIVLDTSILMEEGPGPEMFFTRLGHIAPGFQAEKKYERVDDRLIYIPESCVVEMFSKATNASGKETPVTVRRGKLALERLETLRRLDVVSIIADDSVTGFGDGAICALAFHAANQRLGFILQDKALARDLTKIRGFESVLSGHSVRRVDRFGYLSLINSAPSPVPAAPFLAPSAVPASRAEAAPQGPSPAPVNPAAASAAPSEAAEERPRRARAVEVPGPAGRPRGRGRIPCFSFEGELPAEPNRVLSAIGAVDEGDVLFRADGSPVTLGREIDSGKEACVMRVEGEDGLCAKAFVHPTLYKQRKVELLASRAFELEIEKGGGVVFPDEPIFDKNGVFKGYLMKRLENVVSLLTVFSLVGRNPITAGWDRRQFSILALSIAKLLRSVHSKGILLSDVSENNILVGLDSNGVANPYEVYLIDTDSAQLGLKGGPVYPPDGITPWYSSREEIVNGWNNTMLRTYSSDCFSATAIVTTALLCGLHPFRASTQERTEYEGRDAEIKYNIANGVFAYGSREERRTAGSAAPGLGAYLWSHLPASTKGFLRQALTCPPEERPADMNRVVEEVARAVERFHSEEAAAKHSQLRSLFPTQYQEFWAVCEECGETFDAANTGVSREGHFLCDACAAKPVAFCRSEGCSEPTLTAGERLLGRYAHKFCRNCWEKEKLVFSHYVECTECGRSFPITMGEVKDPPQKCFLCRQKEAEASASSLPAPEPVNTTPVYIPPEPEPAPARVHTQPVQQQPSAQAYTQPLRQARPEKRSWFDALIRSLIDDVSGSD